MPNLPPIKISNELIMATAIMLVGLIAVASLLMAMTLSSSTQNAIVYLYNLINQSQNNSFQLETNGHLAYLQQNILGVSQSCNISAGDSLQRANNLTESDKILLNRIVTDEGRITNLTAYISTLNLTAPIQNCTNTTNTVYVNQTTPAQNCRQALIDKYGLGSYFDVVSCCELREYGFADECCSCYK